MNNEALVLTDRSCTDSDRILKFIQTKTRGLKGEEHEILDSFPVLLIRETDCKICRKLAQFIVEELTFTDGENPAGQSCEEILELLDTTDVYVSDSETGERLNGAGFRTHLL